MNDSRIGCYGVPFQTRGELQAFPLEGTRITSTDLLPTWIEGVNKYAVAILGSVVGETQQGLLVTVVTQTPIYEANWGVEQQPFVR